MSIKQFPLRTDSTNFEFRIPLDGETFTVAFRYNQRADYWMLDIRDSLNTPIISGLAILGGTELIERFVDPELRNNIINFFKSKGFRYVSLDLEGYRPGSMNVAAR